MSKNFSVQLERNWDELWEFNGAICPKFWFGQRVIFPTQKLFGTVMGMEWCSLEMPRPIGIGTIKVGWWYTVVFDNIKMPYQMQEQSIVALE